MTILRGKEMIDRKISYIRWLFLDIDPQSVFNPIIIGSTNQKGGGRWLLIKDLQLIGLTM